MLSLSIEIYTLSSISLVLMRKQIALGLSLIFFVSPTISANASVTPGNICKKLGTTTLLFGKKYTCIKSGKKLVWSKGVLIVKQSPSASPSPTPSLSPAPLPTTSQAPRPTPTPTPIATRSYQLLYSKILSSLKKTSIESLQIEVNYSPKVRKESADILLNRFKDALSFYASRMKLSKRIVFIFFDETEQDWYNSQVRTYEGPNTFDNWWGSTHCQFNSMIQCGRGTNSTPLNILYELVGSEWLTTNSNPISPNHETVHIYQKSIIGSKGYELFPPWLVEGQANTLGFITSSRLLSVENTRDFTIRDIARGFPEMNTYNSTNWYKAILKTESDINFCMSNGLGYSLGMLITEYIYSQYGIERFESVMTDVYQGLTWSETIFKNFGISKTELYENASVYLEKEVNDVFKK